MRASTSLSSGARAFGWSRPTASAISISPPASRSMRSATRIRTLVEALTEQAHKVWHVSNLYRIPEGERLAERLCAATFADTVFFQQFRRRGDGMRDQDGAQIPVRQRPARALPHHHLRRRLPRPHAGHASPPTGNKKYLEGFGPPVDGFDQVPFGDLEAVKKAIGPADRRDPDRADPGRGRRARACRTNFLRALRELCDEHGLLLIFDEVQTGIGRTGELFAYQRTGVTPDVMALAKALGGGFPVGACLATDRSRQGHDRRHARLDLRRQSAGDGGRQRRARRDAGARLPRARAQRSRCCSSSGSPRSRTATRR